MTKISLSFFFMLVLLLPGAKAQGDGDCRLKLSDIHPIILQYNPYFADHKWDQENRMELARLDEHRLLLITQDGCKRHHIVFTLILDPKVIGSGDEYWLGEIYAMMFKAFKGRDEYSEFRGSFEQDLAKKLADNGLNRSFNFPVGTRNFICELRYHPSKGAKITIEMVSYIFRERINYDARKG